MARKKRTKRADGRFQESIQIGRDPETGKPIRKVFYGKTHAELDKKVSDFKAELAAGLKPNHITFSEYGLKWFDLTKQEKAANTKRMYENVLRNHTNIIGDMAVKDIRKSDILLQLNESAGHYPTQEFMLTTFTQIFDCAIDDEIILRNPTRNIKLPSEPPKQERRQLTRFELDCIAAADLTLEERCYISLLLYTGMRRGEVFALTKADVNLRRKQIQVNKAVKYYGSSTEISEPKSASGFRELPVLDALLPDLKQYMKSIDTEYLFVGKDGTKVKNDYETRVLWNSIYKKLNETAIERIKAGNGPDVINLLDPMQGISPHYFRHNFATTLYYAGVDVKDAARLLGHASVNMTLGIYTHLDKSRSHETTDKLNQFLSDQLPDQDNDSSSKTRSVIV
ncbi:MAG: site-specific integrase [Lachnospiraceae bacterium]|nr:site-specific integrase [Lachnospiraceae bacterium]